MSWSIRAALPPLALLSALAPATRLLMAWRCWRWSEVVSGLLVAAPLVAAASALLSFEHPSVTIPRAAAVLHAMLLAAVLAGLPLLASAPPVTSGRWWTPARRVHVAPLAVSFAPAVPLLACWKPIGCEARGSPIEWAARRARGGHGLERPPHPRASKLA